jgi:hypothetical protein
LLVFEQSEPIYDHMFFCFFYEQLYEFRRKMFDSWINNFYKSGDDKEFDENH